MQPAHTKTCANFGVLLWFSVKRLPNRSDLNRNPLCILPHRHKRKRRSTTDRIPPRHSTFRLVPPRWPHQSATVFRSTLRATGPRTSQRRRGRTEDGRGPQCRFLPIASSVGQYRRFLSRCKYREKYLGAR